MTRSHQCSEMRLPSDSSALSFLMGDGDPPPTPYRFPNIAKARLAASQAAIISIDAIAPPLLPGTHEQLVANATCTAWGHNMPCWHTLYGQGASNPERPSDTMPNQLKNQSKNGLMFHGWLVCGIAIRLFWARSYSFVSTATWDIS